jgi:hypothetical protein
MIENNFDVKVKIQDIVVNQLPEFILSENPNAAEFLKQYYISQEYAGGTVDILDNLSSYLKLDYLIPEVISNNTSLEESIDLSDDTIVVNSTKGFPKRYGLLKIDDEIITYTGITTNTFTGCIRGFSGVTDYHDPSDPENLVFSTSKSSSHSSNSTITNLSSLFLKEFFNKIKYSLTPGLENIDFSGEINAANFIKEARSFYQSKGTEESFKILFKVLYAESVKVIDLEKYLLKPSSAEFLRKEIIIAERLSGDPTKIVGQEIYSSIDSQSRAAVSNVEIIRRGQKYFYKLSLFVGYTQETSISGSFDIHAKTKVVEKTQPGSEIISVDSTVGFPLSGSLICGNNTIQYSGKSLNQFYGCENITEVINPSDDIRIDQYVISYENGDTLKEVRLRITGVINGIEENNSIYGLNENEYIRVKSIGEVIPNRDENDKQIFANSWIYNTSSRYQIKSIAGSTLVLESDIDKSSLKLGDEVEILIRGTQDLVTSESNIATVASITFVDREISLNGLTDLNGDPFDSLDPGKPYYGRYFDLRRKLRKANSSNVPIEFGNNALISNILNVYNEYDQYFYVATNGLPSYTIEKNIIQKTIENATSTFLNDQDPVTKKYTTVKIKETDDQDNPFRTGDAIVYQSEITDIPELTSGKEYYAEVVSKDNIKLYESKSFIGSSNYVKLSTLSESDGSHTFTLSLQKSNQIGQQSIVRKFPLTRNFQLGDKYSTKDLKTLGLMCNGVEIINARSGDKIYYGPIKSLDVLNGGSNYDVINPPYVEVSPSIGNTCFVQPVISGSISEVLVDPQDFDIQRVISVNLVGGNGKNCVLQPFLASRYREVIFDGRLLENGGGIDIINETITFTSDHKFSNGQEIIYSSVGNDVGIGIFGGSNLSQNRTLVDGGSYYAKLINNKTIQLYESLENFNVGVNTVGFTTTNLFGNHRFRTVDKKTLSYIKVVNQGENYQNRKLIVKSSGISTQRSEVTFTNHNFNTGDLIQYNSTGVGISGLSTTREYFITKLDEDSFKLSDAGLIGSEDTSNFDRRKYVSFASTGSEYHIFKYPDIKIDVVVSYAGTFTGIVTATPIVRGKIVDAYVYESGTGYGSTIINLEKKPLIKIKSGKGGEVRPVIIDGKIMRVEIESSGKEYYSVPRLEVVGDGFGAKLRAIVTNNKISSIVVIDSGREYTESNTKIQVISDGSGAFLDPKIRDLRIDSFRRYGNEILVDTNNNLKYGYLGYDSVIANEEFNDDGSKHSPIIGWAYDGNPIYGSYGYSDPEDPQSDIKALVPGYKITNGAISDRPVGVSTGFFIEDYVFFDSEDLDVYNGRWCKTPQFPNGTYAYFATRNPLTNTSLYPYFIGNNYRSLFVEDNLLLDQTIDINSLGLIRNTFPYKINEKYADNDFIIESNEVASQRLNVDLVSSGSVDSFVITESGSDYKVGDKIIVKNQENDDGVGFNAVVSEVFGRDINSIQTTVEKYNSFTFVWNSTSEVSGFISTYHSLLDNDIITISGISTYINGLQNNHKISVENNLIYLFADLNPSSRVTDIYVSKAIDYIKPDTILKIENEELTVLNIFADKNVLRVIRGNTSAYHPAKTEIKIVPNRFTFPLKTKFFTSKVDNKEYFNPSKCVGIGTTSGVSNSIPDQIGEETLTNSVYTQSIYLPNHKFQTGDLVTLNLPAGSLSGFLVSKNPADSPFNLPSSGLSEDVYVINKTKDTIGIVTSKSLVNSTAGIYFLNTGNANGYDYEYSFETNSNQVTGTVSKIKSLVSLSTSHNLESNDIIRLEVNPNLTVGYGSSSSVKIFYKNDLDQIVANPQFFTNSNVNVSSDEIQILNHGFVTGDKVYYNSDIGSNISGLTTTNYFVYRVDDDTLKLSETLVDVTSNPPNFVNFSSTGGTLHSLSLVHPPLKSYKNNNLFFDLSDSSLNGYQFKIYYDEKFSKEYISSPTENEFNVVGVGSVGISSDASVTINYSANLPQFLYYSLEKTNRTLRSDPDIKYSSRISFENSLYNGNYGITSVGIASTQFYITLNGIPEKLSYVQSDCDSLRYSTLSKNSTGGISDISIVYGGYGYKKIPSFEKIESENGFDASIELKSSSIGKLEKVTVIDQGYEYSVDKSIRPDAYIPPILNLKNVNRVTSIEVLDGGKNYLSSPSITIFDPYDNIVVNSGNLVPKLSSSSISSVEIIEIPYGLSSVNHKLYTENNTNGISISEISNASTVVTCTLVTPVLGFNIAPFSIGDEIFVEGILKNGTTGTGFNSKDYNYKFFTVTNYIPSSPALLEFDLADLTVNPGIAITFSPNANIVNKKNYPEFKVYQEVANFVNNEELLLKKGSSFVGIDLRVISLDADVLKVDGTYDQLKVGDVIKGKLTGVLATISNINSNAGLLEINYSLKQNKDWEKDTGKLNEEYQVLPNNDYFQNLSYSVRSSKTYDELSGPVNQLLHPIGLKNFADVQVSGSSTSFDQEPGETVSTIVLDISEENRVDTINNFDLTLDTNVAENTNISRFIRFKTKRLTNYINCISNLALKIDDISPLFSNLDNRQSNTSTTVDLVDYNENFANFIIEIKDPNSGNIQFSELVTLTDGDKNIFTLEKSSIYSGGNVLGNLYGYVDSSGEQSISLDPTDPYNTDLDIKVLKTNFSSVDVGIGTQSIGFINLNGSTSSVGVGSTASILSVNTADTSALYVSLQILNIDSSEANYVDLYVTHDGTNSYMSEYYFDTTEEQLSSNFIGTFTSTISSGVLTLKCDNITSDNLLIRGKLVGFGSTSLGISTYRFKSTGQPDGDELTCRLQSNYVNSSGSTSVLSVNTEEISSIKSLVKVSIGNTIAMHQVMMIRSGNGDIIVKQYPILSIGSTLGIGTFGSVDGGSTMDMYFYPDPSHTGEMKIQSYNQMFYYLYDELSDPESLEYGNVRESFYLRFFDSINGNRYDKSSFDVRFNGTPIFTKTFNPNNPTVLDPSTGIFTIKNHFFNTGEQLVYTPASTFTSSLPVPLGIGATLNSVGLVTTILPSDVYAIKITNDQFRISTRSDFADLGIGVTFTDTASGNAHQLDMTKKLSKTVISLDGVVQSPIKWSPVSHNLIYNGGQITGSATTFSLTGISTIFPKSILKIDDEYVEVIGVGIGTSTSSEITGIGTYNLVYVSRAVLGSAATVHNDSSEVRVYTGAYDIVKSRLHFISPPKGQNSLDETPSNLPIIKSKFNGRVFLRQDYVTNTLYDDISSQFTGIGQTMTLTVQGINTTGIETGNSLLFINDIFQTPTTENNAGNNYFFTEVGSETKVVFTGITSTNSEIIISDYDVNQNQLPRNGLIVSLGSTPGLGFAPLVGASLTSWSNRVSISSGSITGVSIGSSDYLGSGYYGQVSIGVTQSGHTGNIAVIRANIGSGGTITGFTVVSGGTGYSANPSIIIPEPTYENLSVVGVSRIGVGLTTETGVGLLMNLEVSPSENVGIGSTLFQVSSFKITRPGYGFKLGDVFKPVGLVTAKGLASPVFDFTLTATDIFTDSFSSWQFGELDYMDSIKSLQNGSRKRFPLKYKGELLTFETDDPILNLNSVLIIFIDGVIQDPGTSYQFTGGSSFAFTEAPKAENNISIFFYRGTRDIDTVIVDVVETIKPGDTVRMFKNNYVLGSLTQDSRTVVGIQTSDEIETNLYFGKGIETDVNKYKPLSWTKQKSDKIFNGEYFYKSRNSLESLIYPTAKIIKSVSAADNQIFVDDARFFNYEEDDPGSSVQIIDFNAMIIPQVSLVAASATCVVSSAGTIQSIAILNGGSGYTGLTAELKIASPQNTYTGIGSTAQAFATVVNGSLSTPIVISNPGLGYSISNRPKIIAPFPEFSFENVFDIASVQGFSGIITGIAATTGTGSNPLGIKFNLKISGYSLINVSNFATLNVGYPVLIFDTAVGAGLTSIYVNDSDVVGIGTSFLNNIYTVASISASGINAEIVVNVKSTSNLAGINSIGSNLGKFSWGRLSSMVRKNPISIGISGYTVDVGLSTFPTIQRRGYGFNNSGSVDDNLTG